MNTPNKATAQRIGSNKHQPGKSPSISMTTIMTSVGARVVKGGWVGLYGRPGWGVGTLPVHRRAGISIRTTDGDHKDPPIRINQRTAVRRNTVMLSATKHLDPTREILRFAQDDSGTFRMTPVGADLSALLAVPTSI